MASSSGAGIEDKQLMQFMSLTGATKEVAEFHLEAAAGKLDVAVEAFYGMAEATWRRKKRERDGEREAGERSRTRLGESPRGDADAIVPRVNRCSR